MADRARGAKGTQLGKDDSELVRSVTPRRNGGSRPQRSDVDRQNGDPNTIEQGTDDDRYEGLRAAYTHDSRYMPPRQYINPIKNLTTRIAINLLEQSQWGMKADIQWTFKLLEKREPVLRALKERRLAAIKRLKWVIRVKDEAHVSGRKSTDEIDAKKQSEIDAQIKVLKAVYGRIKNLKQAIAFLSLATFRGYSHLEKHVGDDGFLVLLEPVPQWYWAQCYPITDWLYNPQAMQVNAGAPIAPEAWVVREVEDPLDEIAVILFLRKNLSKKMWDTFLERFGIPSVFTEFITGDERQPRESDLIVTMQKLNGIIAGGSGALPPGVRMNSTSSVIGSSNHPFEPHLRYNNEELVLAGTGGKLTMLSDATGIGAGASPAHEAVFSEIAEAEGEDICEVLREQVDEPELARRGFETPLVEFALEIMAPEDKEKNAGILGAIAAAGYRTTDEQASEMLEMEVQSVMGEPQQDDGGTGEGEDDGEGSDDEYEGPGSARNKRYYDSPQSRYPLAPQWEAYKRFGGDRSDLARQQGKLTRPYSELCPDTSPAGPDPVPYATTYPTEREHDQYIAAQKRALRKYQRTFAKGVATDLVPLRDEIRSILAIDNEGELKQKLDDLRRRLPDYLGKIMQDSAAARAMEGVLTDSIKRGARVKR